MKISIIADISGRISEEKRDADRITAAAVCLPSGALSHVRKKILPQLPKWRDASDADVKLAVDIVLSEALGIGVYSIEKSGAKWDQFWTDASDIRVRTRGKISFVKAAYQIKCLMFTTSTALACASAIKTGNVVSASTRQHGLSTRETLIFDSEIDGADNVEVFKHIWHVMNAGQPLTESLGIKRTIESVQIVTEQQDRLLLLPDYVAGIAHAAASQAHVLAASRVSAEFARNTHRRLEQSPRYRLMCEPFPLALPEILALRSL